MTSLLSISHVESEQECWAGNGDGDQSFGAALLGSGPVAVSHLSEYGLDESGREGVQTLCQECRPRPRPAD